MIRFHRNAEVDLSALPAEDHFWSPEADSLALIESVSTKRDAAKADPVDAKFPSWTKSIRMSMDETGEAVSSVS